MTLTNDKLPLLVLTEDAVLDRAIDALLDDLIEVGQVLCDAEERAEQEPERWDGMS